MHLDSHSLIENRFKRNLKARREYLNISQAQAGQRCGFTGANISHFETGNRLPSIKNLERLVRGLGTTYNELLA